jgi:MGT family glycosyltransferase
LSDLNVVFTSREFQPLGGTFGAGYEFVGASISERHDTLDFVIDERPLIYISLGTINNRKVDFYRQCFEAFGDLPVQVVLSVGQQTEIAALGAIPANFTVRNFVAQLEVLKRAQVFVTHGGLNSVHEGLYFGVPMVALPQQMEQAIVVDQVQRQGAGIALGVTPPYGTTTAGELCTAVERVLGDGRYAAASKRLGETLRTAGGAARAADVVLDFAARVKSSANG